MVELKPRVYLMGLNLNAIKWLGNEDVFNQCNHENQWVVGEKFQSLRIGKNMIQPTFKFGGGHEV